MAYSCLKNHKLGRFRQEGVVFPKGPVFGQFHFFATGILARGQFLAAILACNWIKFSTTGDTSACQAFLALHRVCAESATGRRLSRRRLVTNSVVPQNQPNGPTTVLRCRSHIVATRRPPEMPPATKSVVTMYGRLGR